MFKAGTRFAWFKVQYLTFGQLISRRINKGQGLPQ